MPPCGEHWQGDGAPISSTSPWQPAVRGCRLRPAGERWTVRGPGGRVVSWDVVDATRNVRGVVRRADSVQIGALSTRRLADAAALMAAEHRCVGVAAATGFGDEVVCRRSLDELHHDGCAGYVAEVDDELVGVLCVRLFPPVGFVPAHGFAIRAREHDPTSIVVAMLTAATPDLIDAGVERITIDHIAAEAPRVALHDAGFGMGSMFSVRSTEPLSSAETPAHVRLATFDDLDSIAELSHIELRYRSEPPMHAPGPERSLGETRALHAELFESGCVHLVASLHGRDVGLLTLETTSPAPRLCPHGAYIGPTATRADVRGRGVGTALVRAALDEARTRGHRQLSVDFDSGNPVSRPFWLGLGFVATGYRQRRVIRLN